MNELGVVVGKVLGFPQGGGEAGGERNRRREDGVGGLLGVV